MMNKALKPVIITTAIAAILGGALALILLLPDEHNHLSESVSSFSPTDLLEDDDLQYPITDGSSKDLLSLTVKRADGELQIIRVSDTSDEYTHRVNGLGNVQQDNTIVSYLVDNMAALIAQKLVEDNPKDLTKYGLDIPAAEVTLDYENGEDIVITFGSKSPMDENLIYCKANDFVFLVNYSQIADIFAQPKDFAELTLFSDSDDTPAQITIQRADFTGPLILERSIYNHTSDGQVDETVKYELFTPYRLPIDTDKGKRLYAKLNPLQADGCEYIEQSEETLALCGLNTPTATVDFTFGNAEYYTLTIGAELSDGSGYYAIFSNREGVYSIAKKNALWADFTLAEVVSMKPFSPYILGCESVEVTTSLRKYLFQNKQNKFHLDGVMIDDAKFRDFFENLSQITCDEFYTGKTSSETVLTVRFTYNNDYQTLYNKSFDEYSLYADDGRKYVMTVNGSTVYKVNAVYVQRILDKLEAITSG